MFAASETVAPPPTEQIARFPSLGEAFRTVAAMVAIFRFRIGMITVLFASCFAGIAFHLFNIPGS